MIKIGRKLSQSKYDPRDYVYLPTGNLVAPKIDLREWDSVVESQGSLGSCEGNAIANTYELLLKKEHPELFTELSRLFVYYNTRLVEGTAAEDAGATIRGGMKAVNHYGICSEQLWPYDESQVTVRPSELCYADAKQRTISEYKAILTTNGMMEVLNNHIPVVVGMEIFDSFMYLTQEDAVVDMPAESEQSLGGHAISVVGYDKDRQLFLAKNSYGTDWGDLGYFWIPFAYLNDYSFEMWMFTIKLQPNLLVE